MSTSCLQYTPDISILCFVIFKVFSTDFSDDFALKGLLDSLNHTFHEFKHHEEIENQYILEKLKSRVAKSELLDILCNIHHDTHVKDILLLVKKAVAHDGELPRTLFKVELQNAIKEFIDDFLPHMKEEEEVGQSVDIINVINIINITNILTKK